MRILFLQDDFPPKSMGGAGFSTYELARGMVEVGHEVSVITTCRNADEAGTSTYHGITVFRVTSDYGPRWRSWKSLYNPSLLKEVERLLREVKPDVIHINNVHTHLSYHSFALARKHARAVVFTARDTMAICFGKLGTKKYLDRFDHHTTWRDHLTIAGKEYNPLHVFFAKRYIRLADKRYAVSNALKAALIENGIEDVEVIHTGTDVPSWGTSTEEVEAFKRKHALEGKRIILFGGRLSESKGGEAAVEALIKIKDTLPDAVLVVAGKVDAYAQRMRERAKHERIEDRLMFLGWIDREEVRGAYAASDVVLVPSLYLDPFPRIVVEAMASGKPVVGSCFGGAPEIIVDGITGYVVDPRHPEEIGKRIADLLRDPAKASRFGRAGQKRIEEDFNLRDTVNAYVVGYSSIIEAKGRH